MIVNILGDPVYGTVVEIANGFSASVSAVNVGTGAGVFKQLTGGNLQFRSLVSANSSITFTQNTDEISAIINTTYLNAAITSAITGITYTANRAIVSNGSGVLSVSTTTLTEIGYVNGVTSAIQTQLNNKEPLILGAATTITSSNLSSNLALISNGFGKVAASTITSTELGYLSGVTSLIQNQINGKQPTITGGATTVTTANLSPNRFLASDASGKIVVSTVPVGTYAPNGILVAIIPISTWNMYTSGGGTTTVTVPHGLTFSKIVGVSDVFIVKDSGTDGYSLTGHFTLGVPDGQVNYVDGTYIQLARTTGSFFDSTSFQSTGVNRGYITIQYIP